MNFVTFCVNQFPLLHYHYHILPLLHLPLLLLQNYPSITSLLFTLLTRTFNILFNLFLFYIGVLFYCEDYIFSLYFSSSSSSSPSSTSSQSSSSSSSTTFFLSFLINFFLTFFTSCNNSVKMLRGKDFL